MIQVRSRSNRRAVLPARRSRRYESFLAHLSATFVELPADQVDSGIITGLRKIVEFLDIDGRPAPLRRVRISAQEVAPRSRGRPRPSR